MMNRPLCNFQHTYVILKMCNYKLETPISFLKPEHLLRAEKEYASRKITFADLRDIQDRAISELVKQQKDCGLEIITDGAYRQINGLRDFWMSFGGVTPKEVISGHLYQDQNSGEVIPKVTSGIISNPSHELLNNFSFLHKEAGDGSVVRMSIPAPSLFYLDLIRNEWYDKAVYEDPASLARDISKAYNETIKDLYRAGCRRMLLIDRSWGRLCDRIGAKRLVLGGINLVSLPQILLQINEDALRDIPEDMHIILYTPFEAVLREECADVVKCVCSHRRVDAFMVDYPENNEGFLDFLKLIPEDKDIVLGVEDSKQPQSLTQDEIKGVLAEVALSIPNHNIKLTTKGGFTNNTDTIVFSSLDEHAQWLKLQYLISCPL